MTTTLLNYTLPMQQDVALFHDKFDHPNLLASPGPLPLDRIDLRISLIREEGVNELREAIDKKDVVAIIDALIDNVYVTLGTLVEMGADAGDVLNSQLLEHDTPPAASLFASAQDSLAVTETYLVTLEKAFRRENTTFAIEILRTITYRALLSLSEVGIDPQPFFDEVQRSNMSKLGAYGKPVKSRGWELDGAPLDKTLKGPNYSKPDLVGIYERIYG
jgi:predicted HAD superfamily Cof-like phosphohydrolase